MNILALLKALQGFSGFFGDFFKARTDDLKTSASVMMKAMDHRVYWIAWSIAAFPLATWFAIGMLDTSCHGCLPVHIAEMPPQLREYADIVWSNIFWTGVTGYGVSRTAKTVERIFGR